jgi:uncharacterized repeat protein (TIGR03833 family)
MRKNRSKSPTKMPIVGDIVEIIVKPYNKNKKVTGKVKRVLTKKKNHTRGHKVMLEDGTVGRMISILKNKSKSKSKV